MKLQVIYEAKMKDLRKSKGFSLIELILVIGILASITAGATLTLSSFLNRNQLDEYAQSIVHNLRKAQSNSMMRIKDDQWGVYFYDDSGGANQEFIFFKGSTYGEDSTHDDTYELPDSLSFSSITINGGDGDEVVFSKVNGETVNDGSIEISSVNGSSYTISINLIGQIEID